MSVFNSPFVIAISPVVIGGLITFYGTRKNKQVNPSRDELVLELRRQIKELKEK